MPARLAVTRAAAAYQATRLNILGNMCFLGELGGKIAAATLCAGSTTLLAALKRPPLLLLLLLLDSLGS
jgi:hypothetical protein